MPKTYGELIERLRKLMVELVEDMRFDHFVYWYLLFILLFGLVYSFLGIFDNGVVESVGGVKSTQVEDIYFSVVTIASLGYGDFKPVGWSRLVASLEVLFGLAFMG